MKVLCGSGGTGGEPEAGRAKAAKYFSVKYILLQSHIVLFSSNDRIVSLRNYQFFLKGFEVSVVSLSRVEGSCQLRHSSTGQEGCRAL